MLSRRGAYMIKEKIIKKISILVALALIITSMSAFVAPNNTKADEQETTEVTDPDAYEMVAHRGFSGEAPENTIPAFEKALDANFDKIEFDIQRCKPDASGKAEWVVSHDANLKRMTGVDKTICDLTYNQIAQYSINAGNYISYYKNLKMPSFKQVINLMKKAKSEGKTAKWNLEIKTLPEDVQEKIENKEIALADLLYDEIVKPLEDADVIDNVVFISFHYSYLKAIHSKNASYPVWFLAKVLDEDYMDYARKCKAEGIIFKGTVNTTSEQDMKNAMSEGFILGAYNVDSRVAMGSYYFIGVRSFTTNLVKPSSMSVAQMKHKYSMKEFTYSLSKKKYTFTNTRKKPTFTVKYEGQELLEGLCYETSYSNNKLPGTATATATGLRNISGEKDKTFEIAMPKVKNFTVSKNAARSLTFKWTANTDITGYRVYYYNYSTKKYVLVKTIKSNKTNTFKAKNLGPAARYRYRVKTYYTYNKKTYIGDPCEAKTTYTKPDKESKITLKRSKSGKIAKIKIGKLDRVTGYNIKLATNKSFTANVKTVTTKKAGKIKVKKLKKKKTYYAKARGYLKVKSVYYYGAYSKIVKKKGVKA